MRKQLSLWFICVIFLWFYAGLYAEKQRIAVIGAGGAGLTTAWLLDQEHAVTLFEAQERLGGHANSIEINVNGTLVPIEAGFEFISPAHFPYFYNLLKNILNVPLHEYTLTTSFYRTDGSDVLLLPPIHDGQIEWHSLSPHDIFTMLEFEYLLEKGKSLLAVQDVGIALEDFLSPLLLTQNFKEEFLYPFLAAGWGVSKEDMKKFAAYNAMKYVVEGKETKHYTWIEIAGGTQRYIQSLASQLEGTQVKLGAKIAKITYEGGLYTILEKDGTSSQFDHLVIATNAKQASQLLAHIPEALYIRSILGRIKYFDTTIAIHGDKRFMPDSEQDWRVVNVRYDGQNSATTVYKKWLSPSNPIFKSWITYDVRPSQDKEGPLPDPLYALAYYEHPLADLNYFQVQKALGMVQGEQNLWFAGNYTHDNDSHESAIVSAINIAQQLAPQAERLAKITAISGD
ncbi:FAD-dependent oxidoreductase [Candidatus Protochlamydia phocaeensis]|uniref:FAD-dependent oxidoreductase n=1 Tax=Candidatus Protochlamydia phocaeensis TaxID=1414722 RepID=UPI00083957A5|nr:FAD-dependent oxidoreductase [Candidatus Protochlamydia phocaeensis]